MLGTTKWHSSYVLHLRVHFWNLEDSYFSSIYLNYTFIWLSHWHDKFILTKHFKWQTFQVNRLKLFLQVLWSWEWPQAANTQDIFHPWPTHPVLCKLFPPKVLYETFSLPLSLRKWCFLSFVTLTHRWILFYTDVSLVSPFLLHMLWPWKASSPNTKISFNKSHYKHTQQTLVVYSTDTIWKQPTESLYLVLLICPDCHFYFIH